MPKLPSALGAIPLLLATPATAQVSLPTGAPTASPAEPNAIPLYGPSNPGTPGSENWASFEGIGQAVRNVTYPTLTPVFPKKGTANGAAVVVAPGGAFMMLAMEHEGWKTAKALAEKGITAFVLKYRILPTPADEREAGAYMAQKLAEGLGKPGEMPTISAPDATKDGIAAIAMVRARAAEWHVDPKRVGMIGFSAGAMTTLNTILNAPSGQGPAFAGYIYGPEGKIDVPADAPPMFAAIAMEDQFFPSGNFPLVAAWHAAGRKVEVHAYQEAHHGFGGGIPGTTTAGVLDQFEAWLHMQGFLRTEAK